MSIIENAARRLEHAKDAESAGPGKDTAGSARETQTLLPLATARPASHASSGQRAGRRYAEIDFARLRSMGMVASDGERTGVAEEFRLIKRPLLRYAANPDMPMPAREPGNPANLVMITSSVQGEGKTFCAINLAMSIATEKDHTALLVDADVARPSILKMLGIHADIGIMDVLRDESIDIADAIVHTNVPSLSIIPAGKGDRYTTELLASQGMAAIVAELAKRYPDRIVIFDSPPLLATTEAQVLAMHMGQVVVVVEAERTTQNQLNEALRLLDGCPNASLLYNKARRFSTEMTYGYY